MYYIILNWRNIKQPDKLSFELWIIEATHLQLWVAYMRIVFLCKLSESIMDIQKLWKNKIEY